MTPTTGHKPTRKPHFLVRESRKPPIARAVETLYIEDGYRRTHHSLESAFGPHTARCLDAPPEPPLCYFVAAASWLRDAWIVFDSGIRAGVAQCRHVRRLQRNRATINSPF